MEDELQLQFKTVFFEEIITLLRGMLKHVFNFKNFKSDLQRDTIIKVLEQKSDILVAMPTGEGRSLCYQLPSIISSKMTIIFCPLLARINFHMKKFKTLNIATETINLYMTSCKRKRIMDDLRSGKLSVKMLYVTPEQASTEDFRKLLSRLVQEKKVSYIVVDESHCECQWIYGLKNNYNLLGTLRKTFTQISWIVLAASASIRVIEDMKSTLCLKTSESSFVKFSTPCFKENLFYDVIYNNENGESFDHLKEFIDECLNDNDINPNDRMTIPRGLIFCKSKEMSVKVSKNLLQRGISIGFYYGEVERCQLNEIYHAYLRGDIRVLALSGQTSISLPKLNMKFVVHWGLPTNLLVFYRQTCLAGLDDKISRCRIYLTKKSTEYYNPKNQLILESALRQSKDIETLENDVRALQIFLYARQMVEFCESNDCRHCIFADYFGDNVSQCISKCDNCVNGLSTPRVHNNKNQIEKFEGSEPVAGSSGSNIPTKSNDPNNKESHISKLKRYKSISKKRIGANKNSNDKNTVAGIGNTFDDFMRKYNHKNAVLPIYIECQQMIKHLKHYGSTTSFL